MGPAAWKTNTQWFLPSTCKAETLDPTLPGVEVGYLKMLTEKSPESVGVFLQMLVDTSRAKACLEGWQMIIGTAEKTENGEPDD